MTDAFRDRFDRALIVSNDTDMLPLFHAMASEFPDKLAYTVSTPERAHHQTLLRAASGHGRIKRSQVEKALFGARVIKGGKVIARRPLEYCPPRF
jgi:hypothetical protein